MNDPVINNIDSKLTMDNWRVCDRYSAETMCCFAAFTTIIFSRSVLCCNSILYTTRQGLRIFKVKKLALIQMK